MSSRASDARPSTERPTPAGTPNDRPNDDGASSEAVSTVPASLPRPHPNGDGKGDGGGNGDGKRGGDDVDARGNGAGLEAHGEPRARELIEELLTLLGEDPQREGLRDTPARAAKALRWLTSGSQRSAEDVIGSGVFEERHDSMVLIRDIEIYSLCEHHMLPFFGRAHVAYVPDRRVVGLSKIARVVDVFARRLQVQERLTDQIADALVQAIAPRGVGVVIEARHLCMMMRGVEKQNSCTITSAVRGELLESAPRREEFMRLAMG